MTTNVVAPLSGTVHLIAPNPILPSFMILLEEQDRTQNMAMTIEPKESHMRDLVIFLLRTGALINTVNFTKLRIIQKNVKRLRSLDEEVLNHVGRNPFLPNQQKTVRSRP